MKVHYHFKQVNISYFIGIFDVLGTNALKWLKIVLNIFSNKTYPNRLWLQETPTASLQKGKTLPMSVLDYDTRQSDGKVPVLEIWGMWSTSSLPLLPGPLRLEAVEPDRVLSLGQIELFDI